MGNEPNLAAVDPDAFIISKWAAATSLSQFNVDARCRAQCFQSLSRCRRRRDRSVVRRSARSRAAQLAIPTQKSALLHCDRKQAVEQSELSNHSMAGGSKLASGQGKESPSGA